MKKINKNSTGFAHLKNKTTAFEKLFIKAHKNNLSHLHVSNGFISYIESLEFINLYLYNISFIFYTITVH